MLVDNPTMCGDSEGTGKELRVMEKHLLCARHFLVYLLYVLTSPLVIRIAALVFQTGKLRPTKMRVLVQGH